MDTLTATMMSPFMMLPVLLLMSYIDMTNQTTVYYLRIAFGASVVLSLAYTQFLKSKIYAAECMHSRPPPSCVSCVDAVDTLLVTASAPIM